MPGLSLRGLSIAISLACVLIGSFTAAYMSIESGDKGIKKTRDVGTAATGQCFGTAEINMMRQTDELIDSQMKIAQDFVESYVDRPMLLLEQLTTQLHAVHPDQSQDWEFLWPLRKQIFAMYITNIGRVNGFGLTSPKGQMMWILEDETTMFAPPDRDHRVTMLLNNGSDYGPVEQRTHLWTSMYSNPELMDAMHMNLPLGTEHWDRMSDGTRMRTDAAKLLNGLPDDGTVHCHGTGGGYCQWDGPEKGCEAGVYLPPDNATECACNPKCNAEDASKPGYLSNGCPPPPWPAGPCPNNMAPFDYSDAGGLFHLLGMQFASPGPGGAVWTSMIPQGRFIALFAAGQYHHPAAATAGITWAGVDLRAISIYLAELPLPGLARVFLVMASDPVGIMLDGLTGGEYTDTTGMLVATSHGAPSRPKDERAQIGDLTGNQLPVLAVDAEDAVVRATARHAVGLAAAEEAHGHGGWAALRSATAERAAEFAADVPASVVPAGYPAGHPRLLVKVKEYTHPRKLHMWIVMCADRHIVLGPIDEKQRLTQESIDASNKQVQDDLDVERERLWIVLCVVVVAVIAVSVVFVVLIVRPLHRLGDEMRDVADMQLDGVSEGVSALSEVARCQVAFHEMVRALKKYRDFMPLSLLNAQDDEEDEEDEHGVKSPPDSGDFTAMKAKGGSQSSQKNQSDGTNKGSNRVSGETENMSRAGGGRRVKASAATAKAVMRKRASFVTGGMSGWHEKYSVKGAKGSELLHAHGQLVQQLLAAFSTGKGIPDTFCGDRMLASFNAVKASASHRAAAARCALALRGGGGSGTGLGSTLYSAPGSGIVAGAAADVARAAVCSVASGDVLCGNMGCPGMMRFSYHGPTVSWAWAMQRYTQLVPGGAGRVCCEDSVADDLKGTFHIRVLGQVSYSKRFAKPAVVHEILGQQGAQEEEEWMYQLEGAEKANPYATWDAALRAAFDSDWDKTLAMLLKHTGDSKQARAGDDPLIAWFRQRAEAGGEFVPEELRFL